MLHCKVSNYFLKSADDRKASCPASICAAAGDVVRQFCNSKFKQCLISLFCAGAKPNADADLALALQMQEEENERQVRFLASQKKANDSSYLQAAAKAPRDVPERQTQSPSAAAGKQAMPGKQNRPSSDKSGAWKFWKW